MRGNSNGYVASLIVVALALIVGVLLFSEDGRNLLMKLNSGMSGTQFEETPRTINPMEGYTGYFEQFEMPISNRTYTYYWDEPAKPWSADLKFPLILVLHENHGLAQPAESLISKDIAVKYPAFIVVPMIAPRRTWAAPSRGDALDEKYALGDIVQMVKNIAALYPVDTHRIYVTGCADGSSGVYGAARFFPDFFAAGISFNGGWTPEDGVNMTRMPLWEIHGKLNTDVPPEQAKALIDIIHSRGGNAIYTEIKEIGGDCSSSTLYTEKVWQWLFEQKHS